MRVVTDLAMLQRDRPTVLTIGAFDGVHRGHQFLIRQVVERARALDGASMVLTFDPRPLVVLRPGSLELTDGPEKERIIATIGPDTLAILPFTRELAQVPAPDFLQSVLDHVDLAELWIGADFAFGHNREGNVDFLIRSGGELGFAVHIVARERLDGVPISSTSIRELVAAGDMEGASRLLGHYVTVGGRVVSGFGRGVELGFPTANVEPRPAQLLPATGIYAAYLRWEGQRLPAALSVGYNVVFGGDRISVEAYVLDFAGDLRGASVGLDFVARIRPERNFDSVEALVAEMHRDVEKVRGILTSDAGRPSVAG